MSPVKARITISAHFRIEYPSTIHRAYFSHLDSGFLLLYVADKLKSEKVLLQALQRYL